VQIRVMKEMKKSTSTALPMVRRSLVRYFWKSLGPTSELPSPECDRERRDSHGSFSMMHCRFPFDNLHVLKHLLGRFFHDLSLSKSSDDTVRRIFDSDMQQR
jgi:hypothetical protein